eukprot:GHVL01007196.1.p1 GENE.GHVL01007196.1~~GHVL01007196.1.p1  ORF type:complete len:155 (+),score=34.05 GHVL01007196.1:26-490(+)
MVNEIQAAREKLKERFGDIQTGGKGTLRRKKRAVHKTSANDDKKMQNTLKRLGLTSIPGIEEVNLFSEDGTVIHFTNPKVQANISANMYVVSGVGESKRLEEMLPSIIVQLGPDNLPNLGKLEEALEKQQTQTAVIQEGDDEDVPELVESFEPK